jgi:hypothetical protein
MALNPITLAADGPISEKSLRLSAHRRVIAGLAVALALGLAGCGGEGDGDTSTTAAEKEADAEILNDVLARELAVVAAYERTLPLLRGAALAEARRFRAQEQEHVDALVKTLRGLGQEAAPAEEEIESEEELKTRASALEFLYDVENASVAYNLGAISRLSYPWPRSLLGSVAANQAQHLVVLRRLLGAGAAGSIPEAFEDGTAPSPSELAEEEQEER